MQNDTLHQYIENGESYYADSVIPVIIDSDALAKAIAYHVIHTERAGNPLEEWELAAYIADQLDQIGRDATVHELITAAATRSTRAHLSLSGDEHHPIACARCVEGIV